MSLPPPVVSRSAPRQSSVAGSTSTRQRLSTLEVRLHVEPSAGAVPEEPEAVELVAADERGTADVFDLTRCSPDRENVKKPLPSVSWVPRAESRPSGCSRNPFPRAVLQDRGGQRLRRSSFGGHGVRRASVLRPCSGRAPTWKNTSAPFRDHDRTLAERGQRAGRDRRARARRTSPPPPFSERNTIVLPSGDHAGWVSGFRILRDLHGVAAGHRLHPDVEVPGAIGGVREKPPVGRQRGIGLQAAAERQPGQVALRREPRQARRPAPAARRSRHASPAAATRDHDQRRQRRRACDVPALSGCTPRSIRDARAAASAEPRRGLRQAALASLDEALQLAA